MSGKEIVDCPILEVEVSDQIAIGDRTYIVVAREDTPLEITSEGETTTHVVAVELTVYTSGYLDRSENFFKMYFQHHTTLTVVRGAEILEEITWPGI